MPKRLRRSAVDDVGEEVPPEAKPGVEWGRRGSQNVPDGDVCGLGSPSPFRAAPALVDDRSPPNRPAFLGRLFFTTMPFAHLRAPLLPRRGWDCSSGARLFHGGRR